MDRLKTDTEGQALRDLLANDAASVVDAIRVQDTTNLPARPFVALRHGAAPETGNDAHAAVYQWYCYDDNDDDAVWVLGAFPSAMRAAYNAAPLRLPDGAGGVAGYISVSATGHLYDERLNLAQRIVTIALSAAT